MPVSFGGVTGRGSEYTVACESAQGVQCSNLNSGNAGVTFTGGANAARTVTLTVTGIEDNVEEGHESVTVDLGTLNAGSGTNLDGGASGSGSVRFDVAEEATIGFTSDAFEVDEGTSWYVSVQLSEPVQEAVRGRISIEVGGSADWSDYYPRDGVSLRIEAGETTGRAGPLTIVQDSEARRRRDLVPAVEPCQCLRERNDPASDVRPRPGHRRHPRRRAHGGGIALSKGIIELEEDGAAHSYTVALRLAPTSDVMLTVSSQDASAVRVHTGQGAPAASATLVFTPENWAEPRTVVITPQDDGYDERLFVEHLLTGSGDYRRVHGRPVIISVRDDDDANDEPDGTITATVAGGSGYTADSQGDSASVAVRDDDAPPGTPVVEFASVTSSAEEAAGTRNVTVNLNPAPQNAVTVHCDIGGTATEGSENDFTIANSGSLSVSAGANSATIAVAINDDSADEPDETVELTLTERADYYLGANSVHTLTITDNYDPPPQTPVVSITGGTASFTLTADPAPQGSIGVRLTVSQTGNFAAGGEIRSRTITVGSGGSATSRSPRSTKAPTNRTGPSTQRSTTAPATIWTTRTARLRSRSTTTTSRCRKSASAAMPPRWAMRSRPWTTRWTSPTAR